MLLPPVLLLLTPPLRTGRALPELWEYVLLLLLFPPAPPPPALVTTVVCRWVRVPAAPVAVAEEEVTEEEVTEEAEDEDEEYCLMSRSRCAILVVSASTASCSASIAASRRPTSVFTYRHIDTHKTRQKTNKPETKTNHK
jgi:hypothetical protein